MHSPVTNTPDSVANMPASALAAVTSSPVRELTDSELIWVSGGNGNGGGTVTVTVPGGGQVHVTRPEGTHAKVTYVAGKGGAGGIDIGGGTVTVECVPN